MFDKMAKLFLAMGILFGFAPSATAASSITELDGPFWLNPGYRFVVQSDADDFREDVCMQIETALAGTTDIYTCSYDSGPIWSCSSNVDFPRDSIAYTFFACPSDECSTGCLGYEDRATTPSRDFNTGPSAITLQLVTARTSGGLVLPAIVVVMVALLGCWAFCLRQDYSR